MNVYSPTYAQGASELNPFLITRASLDFARQQHLLCIRAAIAEGMAADEMMSDMTAFASAAQQLMEVLS